MRRPGLLALALAMALATQAASANEAVLRVCADPNNLPFSNRDETGFENKIVTLLAQDLGTTVEYTWWAQRRGFVRNTLKADACDIWPGIASGAPGVAGSRPYYRSTYVFVTREDRGLRIGSLDDPQLHRLLVGVQMIGNDATNTPPAHALARRGIVGNVRGFMVTGDYRNPGPASAIISAVASGDIDVAIAWGPVAGYFAGVGAAPLRLDPVLPWRDGPDLPMSFDISMGVRFGDNALLRQVDNSLQKNRAAIAAILASYCVPLAQEPFAVPAAGTP